MKYSTIILALVILLFSCRKAEVPGTKYSGEYSSLRSPEGSNISIDSATINAFKAIITKPNSLPVGYSAKSRERISYVPGGMMYDPNLRDKLIGAVHITNDSMWIGDFAGRTFKGYADEFTMLPEWLGQQDVYFLGSLIKGNTVSSLEMVPLSERLGHYQSLPISASISLPGKAVSGIYNPTELTSSQFYSNLLINNGLNASQKASYSYNIQEFTYYDELRSMFGSNVKVNALFFNSGSETNNGNVKIFRKTGLVAKFTQKNFSLDMDTPEPGELYSNLNMDALGGYWPAYVSTITYGSTGILVVESNETSEQVSSTYNKAFSILGGFVSGGSELTSYERNLINNSSMKIYFIGPNGAEAVKSLSSFEDLIAFVQRGSTFSPQSPGVPISFKMKSLKDNKTINNSFRIDVPVEHVYAKIFRKQEGGRYKTGANFFADSEGKISIVAPARITFKANNYRKIRAGSHRDGFYWETVGDGWTFRNSAHLTSLIFDDSNQASTLPNLTIPTDYEYIIIPN